MHPLREDPWVAAQIDAAIAPYRGKWTEEQIEIFREKAAWALTMHPNARRLLDQEHRLDIDESGERVRGAAPRDQDEVKARGSKAG